MPNPLITEATKLWVADGVGRLPLAISRLYTLLNVLFSFLIAFICSDSSIPLSYYSYLFRQVGWELCKDL